MMETEIKGQAFRTFLDVIRTTWGTTIEQQVLDALGDEFRDTIDRGLLLTSGWYPVAWYRQFYEILPQLVPSERRIAFKMGEATTRKDMSGMYSFILKLTSPSLVARHFQRILGSYMRGGDAPVEVTPSTALVRMRGWHGVTRWLWEDFSGGGKAILEVAGARDLLVQVEPQGPGSADLHYQWQSL